ncbi:hypothetical protein IFR05_015387 [Cadophora sp. M221]|nr:hypothetical protein IFR05_015387 [Cadophora sp. M221]
MDSNTYVVPASGDNYTHTIILLHGCDTIASESVEEFFESQASDQPRLRDIFPAIQ